MTSAKAVTVFVKATANRLPTVDELLSLCDACGIGFRMKDGQPLLTAGEESRQVALMVKELIEREPWRSQVIARRLNQEQA